MIRILDKITDGILLTVLLGIFLLGAYTVYDTLYVYSGAGFQGTHVYKPGGDSASCDLRELSEDAAAWITLEDTGVDYPVMQGKTNSQYLNTDPYGEYSVGGSIFLDVRNHSDFSDSYNMIYGHHMEGGAMFGALDVYQDPVFLESHRLGQLTTVDGITYALCVFAYGSGNAADRELFDLEGGISPERRLQWFREHAVYFREPEQMHFVALTTCKETSGTDRTFLICSLAEQQRDRNSTESTGK